MSALQHKSAIWKHFEISNADNSKAICLYCSEKVGRGISAKNYNTSNLWIHMKRHHSSELNTASGTKRAKTFAMTTVHNLKDKQLLRK